MWLDKHWTGNPESVQRLSKLCQRSVQSQKKYGVCPIRYKVCPKSVELLSNQDIQDKDWTQKSNICPHIVRQKITKRQNQTYDKVWTNIGFGQTLDKSWISLVVANGPMPGNCPFDRLWTNIGHGQTLNIHWTWTNSGQTLDIDKLWTKFGYLTFRPITDTWPYILPTIGPHMAQLWPMEGPHLAHFKPGPHLWAYCWLCVGLGWAICGPIVGRE